MSCPYQNICGGCRYRDHTPSEYKQLKRDAFNRTLQGLVAQPLIRDDDIFIADGTRRRAGLTFRHTKNNLILGFNAHHSTEVINIDSCALLTPALNSFLPTLRRLLTELVAEPFTRKFKGRKVEKFFLQQGDVHLCEADNGIDVVLEFPEDLELNHRQLIFELMANTPALIRLSHRRRADSPAETIVEKAAPLIRIADIDVFIPAGTFLQASKASETALINLVMHYLGGTSGRIADLFCGIGTFSYSLSSVKSNKILAVDSSAPALEAFRRSVQKNMLSNITIENKNLFKYPLDAATLKDFSAVIFDPPRAGAKAQVSALAELAPSSRPEKIIAVSCNPQSFVADVNILINTGYILARLSMVDQFVYSPHSELVALFTSHTEGLK